MTLILPSWFPIIGLLVAILALVLAFKNYRRKSGLHLRGNFAIGSHAECEDMYVSTVIVENLKDRGITIFGIYLKVGYGYYIELENFREKPLVLKAFESYHKEYGPIQFYGFNSTKIDLNDLLSTHKIKKRLVLSTGDGKYTIPKPIRAWDPVYDYFNNLATVIAHPLVLKHGDHYVGGNVDYIVDIEGASGRKNAVMLTKGPISYNVFSDFSLTKEALESKASLDKFLLEKTSDGKIKPSFTIYETRRWKADADKSFTQKYRAPPISWTRYYIIGKFVTSFDRLVRRFRNRSRS